MPNTPREERHAFIKEWKKLWEPNLKAIAYDGNTVDPTKVDSKVLEWVKDNCAHKPHFVKVITETAANGRPRPARPNSSYRDFYMGVPNGFIQANFKELDRVVTLENGDGRKWKVSFGPTPRVHHRWLQGWETLAKDNDLKPGEVMVCVLVGNSRFHFKVFGGDGNMSTERGTSTTIDIRVKNEPSVTSQSHQEPSVSTPDLKHPTTRKRLFELQKEAQVAEPSCQKKKLLNCRENFEAAVCRSEGLVMKKKTSKSRSESLSTKTLQTTSGKVEKSYGANSGKPHQSSPVPTVLHRTNPSFESVDPFAYSITSRRRVTIALERQKAWDAAMAHANTLGRAHFVSVMSETQVYRDFHLVLPESFVAESSFPTEAARWKLLDCSGNSWDMYSLRNKRNKVTLHRKHWAQFSLHHFLEDEDVCVFELIEDDALAIVVHIFRVLPICMIDKNSVYAHYEMREK